MDNNTTGIDNNLINQLQTDQLLDSELDSNNSLNITDIITNNSKLNQEIGSLDIDRDQNIISSDHDFVEQLDTNQLSPTSLNSNDLGNIADINSSNTNSATNLFADAAPGDATSVPFSGNKSIDALLYPTKWTNKIITYSFFDGGGYYGKEGNVRPVTEKMKGYFRNILENLENYIDVDFKEVSDAGNNYGQIRYMFSNGPGKSDSSAYVKVLDKNKNSPVAGDVHFNPAYTNEFNAGPGAYRYGTLIHETLHALDLKHPGNYNSAGNAIGPFLPFNQDHGSNTVMSYNRFRRSPNRSGTLTPMAYDIRALQYLYGEAKYNQGDTTYKFGKIDEYTVGGKFFGNPNSNSKQTLWDSGGNDTVDFSKLKFDNSGYRFDIKGGGFITSQNAYLNTTYEARGSNGKRFQATGRGTSIAFNTSINNIVNSSSNDLMIVNDSANVISGYAKGQKTGNDVIRNSNGQDTLDLSGYKVSDFTTRKNGNDLIVDLKGNGLITVDDYYKVAKGDRINILSSGDNPNPNPTPKEGKLVWEEQGLKDENAVATGSKFNLGDGVNATVNWQVITDGGSFVPSGGQDFVSYESGKSGNHTGYLSLGFDNSKDDPDDLIKVSLDFNKSVAGLNFKLLDVDQGKGKKFDDGVEIYADGVNIKNLSGVEILTGSNVMADNESYMNGFEGRGNAGANSSSTDGNIEISFGSTEVSTLEVKYFSTDDAISNPGSQKIGISDLSFQSA